MAEKKEAAPWPVSPRLVVFALLAATILVGASWLARPDGRLHIWFFATPGDAALVRTHAGGFVLIDGGSDPAQLALLLGQRLPLWQHEFQAVVLTGADGRRLPGQVAALSRYRARIALAPTLGDGALASEWRQLLADQHTPLHSARSGDRLALGNGIVLTVLGVERGALALRLDYETVGVVITSSPALDEQLLQMRQRPATALAYPWQRPLDGPLLAAWRPRALIFTTAHKEREPVLLSYHERAQVAPALYHPQNNGTIELISDGQHLWVRSERSERSEK